MNHVVTRWTQAHSGIRFDHTRPCWLLCCGSCSSRVSRKVSWQSKRPNSPILLFNKTYLNRKVRNIFLGKGTKYCSCFSIVVVCHQLMILWISVFLFLNKSLMNPVFDQSPMCSSAHSVHPTIHTDFFLYRFCSAITTFWNFGVCFCDRTLLICTTTRCPSSGKRKHAYICNDVPEVLRKLISSKIKYFLVTLDKHQLNAWHVNVSGRGLLKRAWWRSAGTIFSRCWNCFHSFCHWLILQIFFFFLEY